MTVAGGPARHICNRGVPRRRPRRFGSPCRRQQGHGRRLRAVEHQSVYRQFQAGAKAKAEELGYEIKVIENNFNQAEQDSQVQQQLASGEQVAGYVWWPFENAAGVASLRALSQSGAPVIVSNQYPIKGTEAFWTAYAGANDFLSGKTAAEILLDACSKAGVKCDKGAIIRFPAGVSAGDDRATGFRRPDPI